MRHWLIGTLAGACAVGLAACGQHQQPHFPPPTVGVVVIKEQAIQLTTELPGRTNPFAVSDVRPQVNGIIKARLFVEGSTVKAGQPLYQIDPAPYRAVYDSAEATLISAKAKAARYAALFKQNAIAAQDYDDAEAAWKTAAANAEAARINLGYTRITAPISGRIGASAVTQGALVTAAQATALSTISTLDPIYVDIDQSSTELLALERQARAGTVDRNVPLTAQVTLKLDDGSTYAHEGKLQFTDVTVDPTTGSVRLRCLFPNPEGLLLPGLYVRAVLTQGVDPHGILAPQQGIGHDQKGQPTALVVDQNDIARLRVLKTGRAIGGDWQVLDGLKPGDRMIVQGLQKVQPDMKVSPQPATDQK
ncbi:MAG TPA: efflux RND transporter periplasmic adaptor subunit [Rhizomicrobium sp.]|jgi:membrane fusion protein (multidrug efflux system)|nr:efflux RND transporter periplasmic adaptor subunit [Rhizomicrobium sp.]